MESFDNSWWIPLTIVFALSLWVVRRTPSARHSSSLRVHALRLSPGQEVKSALFEYCRRNSIDAACILTCVGSLSKAHLRYAYSADREPNTEEWSKGQVVDGQFEILSLVGTVSDEGKFCIDTVVDSKMMALNAKGGFSNAVPLTVSVTITVCVPA